MNCERCGAIEGFERPDWLYYVPYPKTKISETDNTITYLKSGKDILCRTCCDF